MPSLTLSLVRALWAIFIGWMVSDPLRPELPGEPVQVSEVRFVLLVS